MEANDIDKRAKAKLLVKEEEERDKAAESKKDEDKRKKRVRGDSRSTYCVYFDYTLCCFLTPPPKTDHPYCS